VEPFSYLEFSVLFIVAKKRNIILYGDGAPSHALWNSEIGIEFRKGSTWGLLERQCTIIYLLV